MGIFEPHDAVWWVSASAEDLDALEARALAELDDDESAES